MRRQRTWKVGIAAAALALAGLVAPAPAEAHCDSLDGPVVQAARRALDLGDPTPVLKWVQPDDEASIRQAFERTLRVRSQGGEARDLADRWFFETLVRIHRAGEGAPYTGLKPAGYEPDPGIVAADRALATGAGGSLADGVAETVAQALRERYERVMALRDFAPDDVDAGRSYVHAYVEYIHFVEALHGLVSAGAEADAGAAESHPH